MSTFISRPGLPETHAVAVSTQKKASKSSAESVKLVVQYRFPCSECKKTYASKKRMHEHWRTVHQMTLTCHYPVRSSAIRLQRNLSTGMFSCALCGREEASSTVMKKHAQSCIGGTQSLELPPFYNAPPTTHTSSVHSRVAVAPHTSKIIKTPPLSFFSVSHQRLVHLERHNADVSADPPTTRAERAQIRTLFSYGCPIEDINRCVGCSVHAVHTVLSRHVLGENHDQVDQDGAYIDTTQPFFQAGFWALRSATSVAVQPHINESSSNIVVPTLEWPSSDEDVDRDLEAINESDDDSEVEVPLSVARRKVARSVQRYVSDRDSNKGANLGPNPNVNLPTSIAASALDGQESDSEDEVPLSTVVAAARRATRGFPGRPKLSVKPSSPSPSPSPVTPRAHAQSVGTPRAWVSSPAPLRIQGDRKVKTLNGNGFWGPDTDIRMSDGMPVLENDAF